MGNTDEPPPKKVDKVVTEQYGFLDIVNRQRKSPEELGRLIGNLKEQKMREELSEFRDKLKYSQLKLLHPHPGLTAAAQQHAEDLLKKVNRKNTKLASWSGNPLTFLEMHEGSNGSKFDDRISSKCRHRGEPITENVYIGKKASDKPKESETVSDKGKEMQLIVDGMALDKEELSRGNRRSIFSRDFQFCGIGFTDDANHVVAVFLYCTTDLETTTLQPPEIAHCPTNSFNSNPTKPPQNPVQKPNDTVALVPTQKPLAERPTTPQAIELRPSGKPLWSELVPEPQQDKQNIPTMQAATARSPFYIQNGRGDNRVYPEPTAVQGFLDIERADDELSVQSRQVRNISSASNPAPRILK